MIIERNLQLWRYSPSFSRLLLLANKENVHEDRLAIVFQGTEQIQLPTYFFCKTIGVQQTDSEKKKFVLISSDASYEITALRIDLSRDKLDFDAPIPLFDDFF